MPRKLTQKDVEQRCLDKGFVFVDKYINNDHKYMVICPKCKNIYITNVSDIWRGKITKCKNCTRKGDCKILLEKSDVLFYISGLILSDGTINHPSNRLTITLQDRDKDYLSGIANFFNTKIRTLKKSGRDCVEFGIADMRYIPKFIKLFNLHPSKTYNPPDPEKLNFTKRQKTCLAIGFIDGDGCVVHKNGIPYNITIKGHCSWLKMYKYLFDGLYTSCKIDKRNQAICHIGVSGTAYLLDFLENNDLPILKRKLCKS